MDSDRSLFSQWNQIETCWKFMDRAIESYRQHSGRLYSYQPGTEGPKEADRLLLKEDHSWIAADALE